MALEPLGQRALHVAIDMQRLFAEPTDWYVPALAGIVANVERLARERADLTLFARFLVPPSAAEAPGRWRRHYQRWPSVAGDRLDPALIDLVAPLATLARPDRVIDKHGYSVFGAEGFAGMLAHRGVDALVFSGVETDVCVLASVLDAVDLGLRVVVVSDAVTSADLDVHAIVLGRLLPRLDAQVEIATTEAVLAAWA
ncbi:cysteine hydrolase family protein [Labrys wisconsinensis]|uniref:Nicotinamidase-related amidase n=1 Tax=Labrys wisconsinensis TaxID=425677 RepID=A0ABU0J8J2_9HYPH|nr:isochorismatase family cysteine hydrolase [Labrys wisconsinensis]MDQ0469846.1 nicotinamidase-related amidase [Labrys wisconsinensis]